MRLFIQIILFSIVLTGFTSCYNADLPKPDKLIGKDKFVKMMVDIYLVQAININTADTINPMKFTQTDLYFSVLDKYKVPDSVFVRSLIYYSGNPKEYERMHVEIMNILNEGEQQFKPKDILDTTIE